MKLWSVVARRRLEFMFGLLAFEKLDGGHISKKVEEVFRTLASGIPEAI